MGERGKTKTEQILSRNVYRSVISSVDSERDYHTIVLGYKIEQIFNKILVVRLEHLTHYVSDSFFNKS